MVGIDYSPAALERARSVVDAADVPALLVHGDISDPDSVASALAKHGLNMEDGLHIRAFIDHDRSYVGEDQGLLDVLPGGLVDLLGERAQGAGHESGKAARDRSCHALWAVDGVE